MTPETLTVSQTLAHQEVSKDAINAALGTIRSRAFFSNEAQNRLQWARDPLENFPAAGYCIFLFSKLN